MRNEESAYCFQEAAELPDREDDELMVAPPELQHCAKCRDNAVFEQDEDGTWLSTCCWAHAIPVDAPDA